VHICTLPVTQIVSVTVAIYVMFKYGLTWKDALLKAGAVLLFFQVTIVSPGSLVRGFYVVYLMVRERDWRDYKVAAILSFWKYIGYLAFPIQMVARFPELARFMAGYWATHLVHIVPVFGERGALLEHWVFDVLFNMPISLRRKLSDKKEVARASGP
jgi:hypothetical protein